MWDWSIVRRGSAVAAPSSTKIRNSSNGLTEPTIEVVVAVLAVVEVKAAEAALVVEHRDDLLDVRALQVVAEVDEHLRALAEPRADGQRGAPVEQVGRVEGRLVGLVLEQQLLLGRQRLVDPRQRLDQPRAARAQVVLAGVVGPVGEPQRLRGRAQLAGDLHALERCATALSRIAASGLVTLPSL